jgi:hypothetical protein
MVDRHNAVIRSLNYNKVHDSGGDTRNDRYDNQDTRYNYDENADRRNTRDDNRQHRSRNEAAAQRTAPPQRQKPMERPERPKPPPKRTRDMNGVAQVLGMATLFLLPISLVVTIIGYATPAWIMYNSRSMGLFKICDSNAENCESAASAVLFTTDTTTLPDNSK